MKIRKFLLFVGIATLAACQPNGNNGPTDPTTPTDTITPPPSDTTEVVISARVDVPEWALERGPMRVGLGPDNTGVYHGTLGQGYTPVYWTAGDHILVWHVVGNNQPDNASEFALISGAGTPVGEFRGKAVVDGQENFEDAKGINYAIFPASALTTYEEGGKTKSETDGNHIYFTLPATQNYATPLAEDNPTFDSQVNVMLGQKAGEGQSLKFGNTMGYLMLRLKGTQKITSMVLTDNEHNLVGKYHAYVGPLGSGVAPYRDNAFSEEGINYINGGGRSLTLNCGSGVTLAEDKATIFYFAIPAGSLSDGFEILLHFYDEDHDPKNYTGTITAARKGINTIVRSEIKVMPELSLIDNTTLTWMIDDLYEQGSVTDWEGHD